MCPIFVTYKAVLIHIIKVFNLIFIGYTEEQISKIQQFPLSSYELFVGKHLEKAVDTFIDSNYENKTSFDDTEINYLAFFGTTEQMKKLLVEECKFIKINNDILTYNLRLINLHYCKKLYSH